MSSKGSKKKLIKKTVSVKEKSDSFNSLLSIIIGLYTFLMLCIFPLYMEKKYINLGEAKYHFFYFVSLVLLTISLVIYIISIFNQKNDDKMIMKKPNITQFFLLAFFIVSTFSFLFSFIFINDSSERAEVFNCALNGFYGWHMGYCSQVIFVLIFFFISKYWKWSPFTIISMLSIAALVYLIAVLQRFNIDILELYTNYYPDGTSARLDHQYIEKFVSTLGQTTWYSSYALLILPFGMIMYSISSKVSHKILCSIFIALGGASICTVNCDSGYVALLLIFVVLFWYSLESNKAFKNFLEICSIMLLTFRVIGILQNLFPEKMITPTIETEALTSFINHSNIMLALTIAVICMCIIWNILCLDSENSSNTQKRFTPDITKIKWLRKVIIIGIPFVLITIVVLIVLVTQKKLPEFLSPLYNIGFLTFDNSWGNQRGFNWRMAVRAISESIAHGNIKNFFFGAGPDCFVTSMNKYCQPDVQIYWGGTPLACAHNEWLNMLVNEGIFGIIAYLGIFVTSAVRLGKAAYKEPFAIGCLAAILSYIGFNFFCYQQCICTPTIFIIMGIGELCIREASKND